MLIKEDGLNISNFVLEDTNEQFVDNDENGFFENENSDSKVKTFQKHWDTEELKMFFLSKEDIKVLAKINDLNIHFEKNAFYQKKRCQTLLTDYFS